MVSNKLDIQKRQHRERSQLAHRSRLGLLEKHSDYVKRARDYHSKQDRLHVLRQKAATRNKDEFYFGMIRSRTERGVHIQSRGNKALETDLVRLLKTQDAGYVRTQRAMEEKRVDKLKEQLGCMVDVSSVDVKAVLEDEGDDGQELRAELLRLIQEESSAVAARSGSSERDAEDGLVPVAGPSRKKTVFVDSAEAVRSYDPAASGKKTKASLKGKGKATDQTNESPASDSNHLRELLAALRSRVQRLRTLQRAERELEMTRALMSRGSKRPVGGGGIKKKKPLENGRELSWYDKLDRNELREEQEEKARKEKEMEGVKTGAKVWKWKAERKR